MKSPSFFSRAEILVFSIVAGSLLVTGAGSRTVGVKNNQVERYSGAASREAASRVVTALPRLSIISVEMKSDDVVEVTLKNDYEKGITAVSASRGLKSFVRRDYAPSEVEGLQELAPGATDKFLYPAPSLTGGQIIICAAIFNDRTYEGNISELRGILDKRRGMKVQLGRMKPYLTRLGKLQGINKVSYTQIGKEIEKIKRVVEAFPTRKSDGDSISTDFEFGLSSGRNLILKHLSNLEMDIRDETTYTAYRNGQLQTFRQSGMKNYREAFQRVSKYLVDLESKL